MSTARLYAMLPLLRFSYERGAYVLRFVGETRGPVLRKDRRRRQHEFSGPERREGAVNPVVSSRPLGGVRRIEAGEAQRRAAKSARSTKDAGSTGNARNTKNARSAESARDTEGAEGATRTPEATRPRAEGAAANRRRRQHGRQRPPRPHR
ncbi:MAG: hypothetical protein ACRDPM_17810 [Solirubrobacteraceae bacterium]